MKPTWLCRGNLKDPSNQLKGRPTSVDCFSFAVWMTHTSPPCVNRLTVSLFIPQNWRFFLSDWRLTSSEELISTFLQFDCVKLFLEASGVFCKVTAVFLRLVTLTWYSTDFFIQILWCCKNYPDDCVHFVFWWVKQAATSPSYCLMEKVIF